MISKLSFKFFQIERKLDETRFLVEDSNGQLYYGESWKQVKRLEAMTSAEIRSELEFEPLSEVGVNASDFFATFEEAKMTKFTGDLNDPAVFVKRQRFLVDSENFRENPERFRLLTAREIEFCEVLIKDPHPNLCEYLGVVLADAPAPEDRITDLVYTRYSIDLFTFVQRGYLRDSEQVEFIIQCVKDGISHLHQLGYVHCDISPGNIFLITHNSEDTSTSKDDSSSEASSSSEGSASEDSGSEDSSSSEGSASSEDSSASGESLNVRIENVVLGDFDAATKEGGILDLKRAPDGWWPEDLELDFGDCAVFEIDHHGLEKIKDWLLECLSESDAS
ncbi:hypothetical protein P280DRAFT_484819 [Massarina eburnea CBS 473.64]|uniref:EKC/KEOPS complex subunit BUD32 n=1 Tax=Massarina eburnea CBS 473.64 TaxID=1395130 RepID=A0A6A6RIV8_9PLEO|nr:hypothetical protein P280DRAFT_484819 [Massarina eburnea CBS 473.64]